MSQLLINDYLKQLDLIKKVSGSQRETIVREAFKDLLKAWGRQHDLVFLAEYPVKTATKTNIAVDGALLHELRMPLGYWEAKDADDDLAEEIAKKFKKGCPSRFRWMRLCPKFASTPCETCHPVSSPRWRCPTMTPG